MKRIAVAIVHGIEIDDPDFAATPARLLREHFAKHAGTGAHAVDEALVVQPIHWAPHLERRERALFARMYPGESEHALDHLSGLVRKLNTGSPLALAPFLASLANPGVAPQGGLHYPTARWIMAHFMGDIIAYEPTASRANYDATHEVLAKGLAALARKAGDDAPLCILAHSFGSVVASDYLWDQQEAARGRPGLVSDAVRRAQGNSALARGDTLAWLYTMGSPLALWSLRYPEARLDRPIDFPPERLAALHPSLAAEWVNFVSSTDVIAYPLRPLGAAYEKVVKEDRIGAFGGLPVSLTPASHPFYWSDPDVVAPIAEALAEGWKRLN